MEKRDLFINKAKKVHGDKFDYSKVNYVNSQTKVCIICPEHGEFWQTPAEHVRGKSCPLCANIKRGSKKRLTIEEFINKAKKVHGNKYDYSKVEYKNASTKVCIICPEHGEFMQIPMAHINGEGCPKCAGKMLKTEDIIKKFKQVHGDKYDYSKVQYKRMDEKVCIICPEHGEFWQTPSKHILRNQGCPKCAKTLNGKLSRLTREEFIKKAKEIHGDSYIYTDVNYVTSQEKVKIICKKHGEFWQRPYDHLNGHGCPHCANLISRGEIEIYEFLCDKIGIDKVFLHNRNVLGNGREIDIYIPDLKFGIEYNGLIWHSEENGKVKGYHLEKTEICNKNGVYLIQIFEDEYNKNKELVLKKIGHILNLNKDLPKIMARKCVIKEITNKMSSEFLENNHIQGKCNAGIHLGCFNGDELIGVMCFLREKQEGSWILSRFATNVNYICQGVGGKLFNYFIKNYNPLKIKSFADRRWTCNSKENFYTKIGFKLTKILPPDYRYINISNPKERIHKFNLRKKIIHRRYNLPMNLTEKQMVKEIGLARIWDCGLLKYEWTKPDE